MKKIVCLLFSLTLSAALLAQNDVSVLSSGTAESEEHAIQLALRNAIEQAFGTFVSANTTILNDELVSDEIATITRGNIKSFDVLSTFSNGNNITVNLCAVVSLDNLISYAKSKGSTAEYAGAAFFNNYKLMLFKAKNAETALEMMVNQIEILHKDMFDYQLSIGEPQRIQSVKVFDFDKYYKTEIDGFMIPVKVDVLNNLTSSAVGKLVISTLKAIDIGEEERKYEDSGIECCHVYTEKNGDIDTSYYGDIVIPVSHSYLKDVFHQIRSFIYAGYISYYISTFDGAQLFEWAKISRRNEFTWFIRQDRDIPRYEMDTYRRSDFWLKQNNSKLSYFYNFFEIIERVDYTLTTDLPIGEMIMTEIQKEVAPSPEEIRTIKKMKRKDPSYEYKPKYETIYGEPNVILSQQIKIYIPLQEMDTFKGLSISRK